MEFTAKDLMEKLGISHVALVKSLSLIPCESKNIETSAKPVKHYKFDDLPQRYKDKLEELGYASKKRKNKPTFQKQISQKPIYWLLLINKR